MAKEVVVRKLVVACNEDGSLSNSLLLYQIKTDGVTNARDYNSINVDAAINSPSLLSMLEAAKNLANTVEGIS